MDWEKFKSLHITPKTSLSLEVSMAVEKFLENRNKEKEKEKATTINNLASPIVIMADSIGGMISAMASASNKPVSIEYPVVGVTFDGRQEILQKYFDENYKTGKKRLCRLHHEVDNAYDKNAVAVYILGEGIEEKIGYISKKDNTFIVNEFSNIDSVQLNSIGFADDFHIGLSILITFKNKA